MADWQDPKQDKHGMEKKMTHNKISELLKIAEFKSNALVCLRFFYQYFHETKASCNVIWLEKNLCSIDDILKLTNKNFMTNLLKLIVVHWNIDDDKLSEIKKRIMCKVEKSQKYFFDLAFLLHEKHVDYFKKKFWIYLAGLRENFGNFHKYFVMTDLPLLQVIMKKKKLTWAINFTYNECSYVGYNSKTQRTFESTQLLTSFSMVKDKKSLVSSF